MLTVQLVSQRCSRGKNASRVKQESVKIEMEKVWICLRAPS